MHSMDDAINELNTDLDLYDDNDELVGDADYRDLFYESEYFDSPQLPSSLSNQMVTCSLSVISQIKDRVLFVLTICLVLRLVQFILTSCLQSGRRTRWINFILDSLSILSGLVVLRRVHNVLGHYVLSFNLLIAIFLFAASTPFAPTQSCKLRLTSLLALCFAFQCFGELYMKSPEWHQIRGDIMLTIMRAVSFHSNHWTNTNHPSLLSPLHVSFQWLVYALCPAGLMFGAWFESRLYASTTTSTVSGRQWAKSFALSLGHCLFAIMAGIGCLVYSTCLLHLVLPDISRQPWLNAFVASQSFRFSHYFVSYIGEAFCAALGIDYSPISEKSNGEQASDSNGFKPIHVVHPCSIELPRSLVEVVVNWNLPMHRWLKTYVYKPVRGYSQPMAILATYVVSSMLHGFNFQLSAVLLSIGLYAYIEFVFRARLASIFDACIASRRCQPDCGHTNKTAFWVHVCNFAFACLAVFHLAYLAVMFDTSNQQVEGYTMQHALKKWSELGFLSHFIAILTFVFSYLIS